MKRFHLITEEGKPKVRVSASTRAGFLTAALEGTFALMKPLFVETDIDSRFVAQETERQFKVAADDFSSALVDFLNEALRQAKENQEAYVGLRLSMITDKLIEGALLGQPVTGYGQELKAALAQGVAVDKNELGYWEAVVSFDV